MQNKQKGFSLIELLIVVAIILIIAAIAIPNLMRSKMAANEASAVASLRTINTSSVSYSTTYGVFPTALSQLGPSSTPSSTTADLLDSVLSTGTKSGYTFSFTAGSPVGTAYSVNADPSSSSTGQRHFYTDQTLVIRANTSTGATSGSNPIG
jgi:type IV pilus assembly protein PilA